MSLQSCNSIHGYILISEAFTSFGNNRRTNIKRDVNALSLELFLSLFQIYLTISHSSTSCVHCIVGQHKELS